MSTRLYEIVMLPDGDYALQRTDGGDGEPLVRIRFSKEAQHYLRDSSVDVARAMIDAGIEAVEQISDDNKNDGEDDQDTDVEVHTLH